MNFSHRCPKGNRQMRRVLNQAANAAVKAKGTIFAGPAVSAEAKKGPGAQDDPRTAQPWLPRRTSPRSIEQPGMIWRDFRPWLIREAA